MYGISSFPKISSAAFESLYAGPPTSENPVKEIMASTVDLPFLMKN